MEDNMGRHGITLVDVVRACLALRKQGRKIGPNNIRLELGRGSMTTISGHLRRLALRDVCSASVVERRNAAQKTRID